MLTALMVSLSLGATTPEVPGILVDRIVAVVDKEVITESQLVTETRVLVVYRDPARGLAVLEKPLATELLTEMLEYLIAQILVSEQARRLGGHDVSTEEIEKALDRFKRSFHSLNGYRAFLRKYGVLEETIRNILRREVRNQKYVERRMRSQLGLGASEEYQARLKQWVDELRRVADIRTLGSSGELERRSRGE